MKNSVCLCKLLHSDKLTRTLLANGSVVSIKSFFDGRCRSANNNMIVSSAKFDNNTKFSMGSPGHYASSYQECFSNVVAIMVTDEIRLVKVRQISGCQACKKTSPAEVQIFLCLRNSLQHARFLQDQHDAMC